MNNRITWQSTGRSPDTKPLKVWLCQEGFVSVHLAQVFVFAWEGTRKEKDSLKKLANWGRKAHGKLTGGLQ